MPDSLITVRGEAVVEGDPELAQITAVLHAHGADRAQIMRRLAGHDHVRSELINGFGDAIEQYEASQIIVHPRCPDEVRHGRPDERYVGTVTWTITVVDFTVLGELVTRLADDDLAELHGPRWTLRPAGEIYRRVREAAVLDAVARGREYAEALGCKLTGLAELTDDGLTTIAASHHPHVHSAALVEEEVLLAGAAVPSICTMPERQLVRARVLAQFTTTAPECL